MTRNDRRIWNKIDENDSSTFYPFGEVDDDFDADSPAINFLARVTIVGLIAAMLAVLILANWIY